MSIFDYFHHSADQSCNTTAAPNNANTQNKQINLKVVTFNITTLDGNGRIHEIARHCKTQGIHVLFLQGTCWGITNTWKVENYTCFHVGKKQGVAHKHTGVAILVNTSLLQDCTVHEHHVEQGRCIAVRVSSRHRDITLISAYIPTEESQKSSETWHVLTKFLNSLPRRTMVIAGMDANAHVNMNEPSDHWYQQPRTSPTQHNKTNDNGRQLITMIQDKGLFIANSKSQHNNWTHQSPDATYTTFIDYILVSQTLRNKIQRGGGPDYDNILQLRREGANIDHLPVMQDIQLPYHWRKIKKPLPPMWDKHKLTQAAQAWETHRLNQQCKHPKDIPQEHLDTALALRQHMTTNLNNIRPTYLQTEVSEINIDDLASTLDHITKTALHDIIPHTRKVTIKQQYIDEHLWSQIETRQQMWRDILTHACKPKASMILNNTKDTFTAWVMYTKWIRQKRIVQRQLKQAKQQQLDKLLQESENKDSLQDIRQGHAIIRKLAPKPTGKKQQIQKRDGSYAHTQQQEREAYAEMVHNTWGGTEINLTNKKTKKQTTIKRPPLQLEATNADVVENYRQCKVNKAMKNDTRPAEILHIASDLTAPFELQLWKGIAHHRQIPEQWEVSDVVMIPKPGKDPTSLANRRGINKIDSGLKAYSSFVQSRASRYTQHDSRGEWGGLKKKGTRQPLKIVEVMLERAKHAKADMAIFAGDIHQAFDSAKHDKLDEALDDHIDHPTWPGLISDRHKQVTFRFTTSHDEHLYFDIPQGAVQGCSLGPMAFNIYYRAYTRKLDEHRTTQQKRTMTAILDTQRLHKSTESNKTITNETTLTTLPPNKRSIRLDRSIFVDDHLEMWATKQAGELRSVLAAIVPAQKEFNLHNNFKKTQIAIQPRGRQSRKRLASYGGKLRIAGGEEVQLTNQILYLGTIVSMNNTSRPAVTHRIRLAQAAHSRLTPNIYRSPTYSLSSKIKLFKTHELTVLLHGMDTKILTQRDVQTLERWQMSKLRHIAKSQAHVTRETNFSLRRRLKVFTIESNLRHQRLKFMQQVYQNPVTNAQLLASLYGTLPWDPTLPTCTNNRHMNQLYEDIVIAWTKGQQQAGHADATKPAVWEHNVVGPCMQHWLVTRTSTELAKVLTHVNPFDTRSHKQAQQHDDVADEGVDCSTCHRIFRTIHALSVHKVRAHGERNKYRAQVVNTNCPGCDKSFSNIHNAQAHWAKQICVRNQTAIRSYADLEAQSQAEAQM